LLNRHNLTDDTKVIPATDCGASPPTFTPEEIVSFWSVMTDIDAHSEFINSTMQQLAAAPRGWDSNNASADYSRYKHLVDIMLYIGNPKYSQYIKTLHQNKFDYVSDKISSGYTLIGPLNYADIKPYLLDPDWSKMYDRFVLNCVFDRYDCSVVRVNPMVRQDLGSQCVSFGLQYSAKYLSELT
jgi:hypothetical protein